MTTEFKIRPHLGRPGDMVEVWIDGKFVAAIYDGEGHNVRKEARPAICVVSKYFEDYCYYTDSDEPGKITITLDPNQ
jgi:hypothetical protein